MQWQMGQTTSQLASGKPPKRGLDLLRGGAQAWTVELAHELSHPQAAQQAPQLLSATGQLTCRCVLCFKKHVSARKPACFPVVTCFCRAALPAIGSAGKEYRLQMIDASC